MEQQQSPEPPQIPPQRNQNSREPNSHFCHAIWRDRLFGNSRALYESGFFAIREDPLVGNRHHLHLRTDRHHGSHRLVEYQPDFLGEDALPMAN